MPCHSGLRVRLNSCGDGTCSAGEDPDSCPADCPPCGVVSADGGIVDDTDACFLAGGPVDYLRAVDGAGYGGSLVWTHATASALAIGRCLIASPRGAAGSARRP